MRMPRRRREPERKPDITPLRRETQKRRTLRNELGFVEHRHRILTLIRNGANAEQAAGLLNDEGINISAAQIRNVVKRYLDELHTEDALTIEQQRVLENERLDALWRQLSAHARNADGTPNLKIIDRMTRLSERRSKMNGFEAAQKHEHVVRGSLAALGVEQEHLDRAQQAWLDVGGKDVDVIDGEAEEVDR